jgi:predicted lipoprotein with Yx(FWY)xxD motif
MKKLLILGAAIAAAAVLAACGSGGGGATATAMSGSGGAVVSAKSIGGVGRVLVDSSGQALYASDQETAAGKVLCTGACNSFWMPLTASGNSAKGSVAGGKLGVVKRPDGGQQVTYNGKLLYTFTQDKPGQATGDGFQDAFNGQQFTWHVVSVSGNGSTGGGGSTNGSGSTSGSGGAVTY